MMALRHRLTLLAAGTVGVTVVLVAIVAYVVLRGELRGQVDDALATQYTQVLRSVRGEQIARGLGYELPAPSVRAGGPSGPVQLIDPAGNVVFRSGGDLSVPIDGEDRTIAGGNQQAALRDIQSPDGVHLRVLTVAFADGGAIQLARSLTSVDATLGRLRFVLLLLCAGGTLLAAFFGRLFGRQVIQPVTELTAAAEHITQTDDLGRRIEVRSDVTGVRSSCEASATSWRWECTESSSARRERSSASSIALKRCAIWPTSSSLRTSMRRPRSSVCVMCSAAAVSSVTGWTTWRPKSRPKNAASSVPPAHSRMSTSCRRPSVASTLARLRASWIAPPSGNATVRTRRWTPSALRMSRLTTCWPAPLAIARSASSTGTVRSPGEW